MKFKQFLHNTFRDSSIHGFSYFARSDLHWIERVFWALALCLATFFSISICLNQWTRFRENPIIYAMELTWGKTNFPYSAVTICSNTYEEAQNIALVEEIWQVSPNNSKFQYYMDYLDVVNNLRFDNMQTLQPFANDTSFNSIKYLELLLKIRKRHMELINSQIVAKAQSQDMMYVIDKHTSLYAPALTEAGLCRTTSQTTQFSNPFGKLEKLPVSDVIYCGIFDVCDTKVFPFTDENTKLRIYMHSVTDVVSPSHRTTLMREVSHEGSLNAEVLLSWTAADTEVRDLPVAYRKCRFPDENHLNYFDTYQPGLCRMECHIKAALSQCNCKPFFYVVGPHSPICDVNGMLCLVQHHWTQTFCNCVPLCDEITYTSSLSSESTEDLNFIRTILIKLSLPRMAIKRHVVFSTDQLLMSFGGAIGFFLGASFLSIYGLIYMSAEFLLQKCCKKSTYFKKEPKQNYNKKLLNKTGYRNRNTDILNAVYYKK